MLKDNQEKMQSGSNPHNLIRVLCWLKIIPAEIDSDGRFTYSLFSLSSVVSVFLWFVPPLASLVFTYYLYFTETDYIQEATVIKPEKKIDIL
jgi:hypothetical protein